MPLDALVTGRIATFRGATGFGWVEAIGISDGRVAFAGSAVDLETRADPHTVRVDLDPDEIAIPGLTDAHLHLADAAIAARQVDLTEATGIPAALEQLRRAADDVPAGEWLLGGGWDQRRFGRWPVAADLDGALGERLVALWSFDHHALWVSSAAMRLAGIADGAADPPGGLLRRGADGRPDGVLLENACGLVAERIPEPSDATVEQAIEALAGDLLRLGVVGVHDPGHVAPDPALRGLDVYGRLADAGRLGLRVHACVRPEGLEAAIDRRLASGMVLGGDPASRARMGWLKLFADGTLGSRTAALLEPIAGPDEDVAGDRHGVFRMSPATLSELAARAAAAGIASQIHAIGDAAARAALDALEPTVGLVPFMPRVEHVQLVHPDDVARFGDRGIAASVQPVHLREDASTARRDWGDRAESDAYTWRTLLDTGAVLAFGTDAPVEPIDPWPGIAMALRRYDPSWGPDAAPFGPRERLTLDRALRAATVGPAATTLSPDLGRLVPGCRADLIVLPPVPVAEGASAEAGAALGRVRPRLVMLDGEVVVER